MPKRRTETSEARYEIVEDNAKVVRELFRRYVCDQVAIGDLVRIQECRPYSKEKRWRLLEILERAK